MKLVVSVTPRNLEEAQQIDAQRFVDADLIEWRADFLEKEEILKVAPAIFEKFAGRELIFTLRTKDEGGHIQLSDDEYVEMIKKVTQLYQPDYVDFEYFSHSYSNTKSSCFISFLDKRRSPNMIYSKGPNTGTKATKSHVTLLSGFIERLTIDTIVAKLTKTTRIIQIIGAIRPR